MISHQVELVLAKPTEKFHQVICHHITKNAQPSLEMLNIDQTGYFINKHQCQQDTVDEIARHYQTIYSNELRRWLGPSFQLSTPLSLVAFMEQFTLAFHQNVYFQKNISNSKKVMALKIEPTEDLGDWFQVNTILLPELLKKLHHNQLIEDASILLFRLDGLDGIEEVLALHHQLIAELEFRRLALAHVPKIEGFYDFRRFFKVSIHQHLKFLDSLKEEI